MILLFTSQLNTYSLYEPLSFCILSSILYFTVNNQILSIIEFQFKVTCMKLYKIENGLSDVVRILENTGDRTYLVVKTISRYFIQCSISYRRTTSKQSHTQQQYYFMFLQFLMILLIFYFIMVIDTHVV